MRQHQHRAPGGNESQIHRRIRGICSSVPLSRSRTMKSRPESVVGSHSKSHLRSHPSTASAAAESNTVDICLSSTDDYSDNKSTLPIAKLTCSGCSCGIPPCLTTEPMKTLSPDSAKQIQPKVSACLLLGESYEALIPPSRPLMSVRPTGCTGIFNWFRVAGVGMTNSRFAWIFSRMFWDRFRLILSSVQCQIPSAPSDEQEHLLAT